MKRILIIDGNNQAYRAYHKLKGMRGGVKGPSSVVYGVIQTVRTLVDKYKPHKVFIPFDGGKSQYRLDIAPDYKKRDKGDDFDYESFKSQTKDVRKMLSCLNCKVFWKKGFEADDVIYKLGIQFKDPKKYEVIIISSDKDFGQMLTQDNVKIFNPINQVTLTPPTFYKRMGFHPYQVVDFLSLWGDKSDNIPGYPGIGEVLAKRFLEEYYSISEYLDNPPDKPFRRIDVEKLRAIQKKNDRLIALDNFHDFMKNAELRYPRAIPAVETFNLEKFKKYCNLYGINKMKGESFLLPFKRIKSRKK